MLKYLLLLLPLTSLGQSMAKYYVTLTPVVEDFVSYQFDDVKDTPTVIHFTATTFEATNSEFSITVHFEKSISKRQFIGRQKDGSLAYVELLSMKSVSGKNMAVIRLTVDKSYLFFPDEPKIQGR